MKGWRRLRYAMAGLLSVALAATAVACSQGSPVWRPPLASETSSASPTPAATPTPVVTTPPPARRTPIKVALFGDSQATALYNTRPKEVSKYLTLSNQSISACGIMRGQVVSRSGERFNLVGACPNWLSEWRKDAKAAKADIALVILGAWDLFDVKTDKKTIVFGTAEWDAAFMDLLRSGLAAIRESGTQIALAEVPCYRPRQSNPRPPGWWPERGEDQRVQHVNELLNQAADGSHIFIVKPAESFCTDKSIGDNRKNRYDGVHYLQPGAKIYFDAIIPQLVTLPE